MNVPLKPRTVGELVGHTFSLAMSHFGKLFFLMAILNIPNLWLSYSSSGSANPSDPLAGLTDSLTHSLIGMAVSTITGSIGTGACIVLVASSFTGQKVGLWESVTIALRKLFTILGASLAFGMVLVAGFILLFVPGLIWMTWFYVVVAVVMLEDKGVFDSFGRSRQLVRGHGWSVFGFVVIITIITMLIISAAGMVLGISQAEPVSLGAFLAFSVATIVASLFSTVSPVVVYFDLRVKNEAFDVQSLTDIVMEIGRRRSAAG